MAVLALDRFATGPADTYGMHGVTAAVMLAAAALLFISPA
jgi:hypothetical protein